jgi:hypothetical protein
MFNQKVASMEEEYRSSLLPDAAAAVSDEVVGLTQQLDSMYRSYSSFTQANQQHQNNLLAALAKMSEEMGALSGEADGNSFSEIYATEYRRAMEETPEVFQVAEAEYRSFDATDPADLQSEIARVGSEMSASMESIDSFNGNLVTALRNIAEQLLPVAGPDSFCAALVQAHDEQDGAAADNGSDHGGSDDGADYRGGYEFSSDIEFAASDYDID